MSIEIRTIAPQETLPLRCEVLRSDQPISASIYPGDDDSSTQHWGVFRGNDLIAVASIYQEALSDLANIKIAITTGDIDSTRCWRLRGMAVSPMFQGQGYGRKLLDCCLQSANQQGGLLLWCNARTSASGFYNAAGFETASSEFMIPDIGPHSVMLRLI